MINLWERIIGSMLTVSEIDLPDDASALLASYEAAAQSSPGVFGGLMALLPLPGRAFTATRGKLAREALDLGRCVEVRVRHDGPPVIMSHEHGVIVLIAIDGNRTLMLDVSSVGDDPRWDLHQAGKLMRRDWRWLRLGETLGASCFKADGPAVTALDHGELHGTKLEQHLLAGEGWLGDDAVVGLSLEDALRLAHQPV